MLEQEVVSERDLRSKADRTKDDVERDLVDALEQLRIANINNAAKDKDIKVSNLYFLQYRIVIFYLVSTNWIQPSSPRTRRNQGSPWSLHWNH